MFDLEVEGVPEFYANGILLHNSMDAIQYVATRLFASGMELSDEDDARPFVEPWRSHAAGRRERS